MRRLAFHTVLWAGAVAMGLSHQAAALPPEGATVVDQAVSDLDPLATQLRKKEWGLAQVGENTALYRIDKPIAQTFADLATYLNPALNPTHNRLYYRVGQGYRARLTQPDYLIKFDEDMFHRPLYVRNVPPVVDGKFVELVPDNTVYELSTTPMFVPAASATPDSQPTRALQDVRPTPEPRVALDSLQPQHSGAFLLQQPVSQASQRVDGRVDARVDGEVRLPTSN
ncbi:MAG: hypothetical protein GC164_11265 [Phycisphaera sp.]|nr:hypothetical protein [Phycisphaera sp.]